MRDINIKSVRYRSKVQFMGKCFRSEVWQFSIFVGAQIVPKIIRVHLIGKQVGVLV
jgi:hypothetical protein